MTGFISLVSKGFQQLKVLVLIQIKKEDSDSNHALYNFAREYNFNCNHHCYVYKTVDTEVRFVS